MPEKLIHAERGREAEPEREPFGARLAAAMAARGPLCVGIDPHPRLLSRWGLRRTAAGLERFALTVVDALADSVPVLKPQSAFFEAFGSAGIAVLEKVIARAQSAGALVLLDVKRGDIGSTMDAYTAAYLTDGSPLAVDAVTLSPFLGVGSLKPALDAALASGRGAFLLCRTSNPEGDQVQLAQAIGAIGAGNSAMTVAQQIADAATDLNAGASPMGSIGVVVGATVTEVGVGLAGVNGPILAPGLGAQGGTVHDLRRIFGDGSGGVLPGVLPTVSRGVLAAGPSVTGLREAAAAATDDIRRMLAPSA